MTNVEQRDSWVLNGVSLGSGETVSRVLKVRGGDEIRGIVERSSNFDIDLVWLENDGTDNITESVASSVSGVKEFREDYHSPHKCRVEITDTSSSSDTVSVSLTAE